MTDLMGLSRENLLTVEAKVWTTDPSDLVHYVRICFGLPYDGTPPYFHLHEVFKALLEKVEAEGKS